MLLLSLPIKSREWLARDVMNTLTLIPALFFTSLIQTAGHKMAAFRSSFSDIQTSKQKSTRNRAKKNAECIGFFIACLFIGSCDFSVRFSFN